MEGTAPEASSANYNSGLGPDFKFELLPLHSPLLGQSLLVSFPPLIDMLKFSGYSYLIRGQPLKRWGFPAGQRPTPRTRSNYCVRFWGAAAACFGRLRSAVLQRQAGPEGCNDARTGMPARILAGAMCVQRFDDSRNSAIHITYRISLRSSSMPEPRDPLLKVLTYFAYSRCQRRETELRRLPAGAAPRGGPRSTRRSNV